MNKLKLNNEIGIDVSKLIQSRMGIYASSGGGKSHTMRRMIEQGAGKVQQIVIDPEGEFASLREKYDFVLVGKEGDLPADPRTASMLARKLLEHNASAVIDLYELSLSDRKRFVHFFLESMVEAPKNLWHPVIVYLDEAHVFAPENGSSESLEAVAAMASRGRKRQFALVCATQRAANFSKDVSAQLNNKLIGRTTQDVDVKRVAYELGLNQREAFEKLRLKPGNFFAMGPAISESVIELKIGPVETTHDASHGDTESSEPTPGVRKILSKLTDLPQQAFEEARTVSGLQDQVRTLTRQLSEQKQGEVTADSLQKALEPYLKKFEEDTEESAVLMNSWLMRLQAVKLEATDFIKSLDSLMEDTPDGVMPRPVIQAVASPVPQARPAPVTAIREMATEAGEEQITGPEQRILDAVKWLYDIGIDPADSIVVAFLAGYTSGSRAFTNPKAILKRKGLIEYPGSGGISITDEGKTMAGTRMRSLTKEDVQNAVLAKLAGPEKRVLEPLLASYPSSIGSDELAVMAGYSPGSRAFTNPRGRLKSLGLIQYPSQGQNAASNILFLK